MPDRECRIRVGTLFLIFLPLALSVSACHAETDRVLEERIEQTYPVEPGATVSIRNTDGSIRVYGANVSEVKLEATKKAYSAQRLNKIAVNVSAQPGAIVIDTQYPPKPKWGFFDRSGTVDYVIVIPFMCSISRLELANGEVLVEGMRGNHLHASLGKGRLFGHNCFGDIHFEVENGGLDVAYDWWENRKFSVKAEIANGTARAFIPSDASFHLLATSANGNVVSDFPGKHERERHGANKIDEMVGGASEANVNIHATNGSVKIAEANP
ncbi:MAG: hypothetical protein M3R29_06465 [Verrucomicrobiota bacterium]|nr:hypothetical protein [Verrucomicrobiota bacterium]